MTYVITGKEKRHIFDRHYQFCVGSGHAPLALRTDYVAQLKRVHEELGIERVRFHGIFDEDMKVVLHLKSYLPMPGMENTTSMMVAPPSMEPNRIPITVRIGISAFGSACP